MSSLELDATGLSIDPVFDNQPCILLHGVSRGSALGQISLAALAGLAKATFDGGSPPETRAWRRAVGGTALQWWSAAADAVPLSPLSGSIDISLDLHQRASSGCGRTWCIVDAAGLSLLSPFHALGACHSAPYIASANLIESADGGGTWQLVAEAHVSSARSYRELLDVLGRTSARLLRMGLRAGFVARRPWNPAKPAPRHPGGLLRANVASSLAWIRARVGGDMYGIAVLDEPEAEFTKSRILNPTHWLRIPASQGFIADPFFWPGRPGIILCETYYHHTGLGELTALTIDAGAIAGSEPMPLGLQSHLSYPSTWLEDGRVFCLPEMAASRRQVLYELRAGAPPQALCVINEGVGMADPTLMKVGGLYWIAYTDTGIGDYDNLCLLYAERLEGPWRPHVNNPVKIDVRSCRPGGTPFCVDGQLFRPAQDCSREYGGALVVNRVEVCTPDEYREQPAATLLPNPDGPFPDGLHTLSFGNGHAVIDGKRISYHPAILIQKILRRVKMQSTRGRSSLP